MATITGKKGYWANETIVGTPGDDVIDGTGGNDDIDGGAGIDTVLIFESKENFKITSLPGVTRVVENGKTELKYDMAEMFFRNVEIDTAFMLFYFICTFKRTFKGTKNSDFHKQKSMLFF